MSRQKEVGNTRDADNRSFKVRIDAMSIELEQNNNRIVHLAKVKEQKEVDIQNTTVSLGKEQSNIA